MQTSMIDIGHMLFSLPVYFLSLLVVASVAAYRQDCSSCLYRWRFFMMGFAVMVYLYSAPVFSNAMLQWLEMRYPAPQDTHASHDREALIVVLTSGRLRITTSGYEVKLSEEGWERMSTAVKLWQQVGGILLFSGAPTPDGTDSGAAGMARAASLMGVPQDAILIEGRSLNTYENFKLSLPLINQHGKKIFLVTSALHMPRAMAVARSLGINATSYPCDFRHQAGAPLQAWLPSNNGPRVFEETLHEMLGMLIYRIRGWI